LTAARVYSGDELILYRQRRPKALARLVAMAKLISKLISRPTSKLTSKQTSITAAKNRDVVTARRY